jgi:hypothetical protein
VALAAVAVAVVVAGLAGRASAPGAGASSGAPRLSTAVVSRTDLSTEELLSGTLGDAPSDPVVNQMDGTYTWLPDPGTVVGEGQTLYRVDGAPVVELGGPVPSWRALEWGVTPGPDVAQLNAALGRLGYWRGPAPVPANAYTGATAAAVGRWQVALGVPVTDTVALGAVAFLPGPVRVAGLVAALGAPARAGDQPLEVTGTGRQVAATVDPSSQVVPVTGQPVAIVLPNQQRVAATVTAVSAVVAASGSGSSGSGSSGSGSSGASGGPSALAVTVTPADPAATGVLTDEPVQVAVVTQVAHQVLAVPVSALLALAGGGDAVELAATHRLVPVVTGLFAGSRVAVRGPGLRPGVRVVVAQ